MEDESKFTRVYKRKNEKQKGRLGLIIIIAILLLILGIITASFFIKDKSGMLYIDKIKMLITKEDINSENSRNIVESKYKLEEYLTIEEKYGSNENFKYQYIVFTDKLPDLIYKDFVLEQDIFTDKTTEKDFEKRELKSHAEIYDDILFIYSVYTYYIEQMPTFSNILTLTIDLNNNTLMSNNEIIAKFDYNPVGIYTKVLENIVENTTAKTYYLEDNVTKVSKEEFTKNIQKYANDLTDVQDLVVRFFVKDKKFYVFYTEPSILQFLNLTYDKGAIDETEKIIELVIVKNDN